MQRNVVAVFYLGRAQIFFLFILEYQSTEDIVQPGAHLSLASTRDQTHALGSENHWNATEVPGMAVF